MIPSKDGWYLFHEDGMHEPEPILVIRGHVADDDDWEQSMGRPPSEVMSENYWEGSSVEEITNGPLTTGKWSKYGSQKEKAPRIR